MCPSSFADAVEAPLGDRRVVIGRHALCHQALGVTASASSTSTSSDQHAHARPVAPAGLMPDGPTHDHDKDKPPRTMSPPRRRELDGAHRSLLVEVAEFEMGTSTQTSACGAC